jgi:hypothetical protein
MQKSNAKAAWWGQRKPMYEFIENSIESGVSEIDALVLADSIFQLAVEQHGDVFNLKKIASAFRVKLGPQPKGRPKKRTRCYLLQPQEDRDAFADAFRLI